MKRLSLIFCLIFLVSCSPVSATISKQPTVTQSPSFTSSAVIPTDPPHLIPTSPPTIAIPTNPPTEKPKPVSAIIPAKYELPDWIKDPESTVALLISDIKGNIYKLSFLNLRTKDSVDISITYNLIRGYFWMPDGTHFGFLSSDTKIIFLIDADSGNVEQYPVTDNIVRFLTEGPLGYIEPLIAYGRFQKDDFYLVPAFTQLLSADLKYRASIKFEDDGQINVIVENLKTGKTAQLNRPGLYGYQFSWSPVISNLEILQTSVNSPSIIPNGDKMMIYTPNFDLVASFDGDFMDPVWSPDGSQILYKEKRSKYPCILEIKTGAKKCIRKIEKDHLNSDTIIKFKWSRAGDRIFYIHYAYSQIIKSGLCIYNLSNGDDFCPTTGVSGLKIANVEWYMVSPDEQFFVFSLGGSCAECDYWGDPSTYVISLDGKIAYSLGKEIPAFEFRSLASYPMSSLVWRPNVAGTP